MRGEIGTLCPVGFGGVFPLYYFPFKSHIQCCILLLNNGGVVYVSGSCDNWESH